MLAGTEPLSWLVGWLRVWGEGAGDGMETALPAEVNPCAGPDPPHFAYFWFWELLLVR